MATNATATTTTGNEAAEEVVVEAARAEVGSKENRKHDHPNHLYSLLPAFLFDALGKAID
jgi:hypothetical protein